jgi:hypothetical protein
MDDYLSKPIRRVALDAAVYRWLRTDQRPFDGEMATAASGVNTRKLNDSSR